MPDYDLIAILGPTASGKTPFCCGTGKCFLTPKSSVRIPGKSTVAWTLVRVKTSSTTP